MADLVSLLDLADLAIARAEGTLDLSSRADIAQATARLRSRARYVGDFMVVALAGGTGSGKSSLLNALVSESVVSVGVVRPTTSGATAVVPAGSGTDFAGLVKALNIDTVVRSGALTTTIFVDLPDYDSIQSAHRHIVERVLPTVDAVVWVFDPEKYADSVVHDEFLSTLTPYEDQFIFVLNQVDRLGTDAPLVQDHLASKLADHGYHDPQVVQTVAAREPQIDEVVEAIANRFSVKTTALAKAALDLRVGANTAWRQTFHLPPEGEIAVDRSGRALARATFVWLGVDAYDYWYSIERGRDGRHRG